MSPLSGHYWGVPGFLIFWILFVVAFGLFARRLYFLFRLIRLGKPENRFDKIVTRACARLVCQHFPIVYLEECYPQRPVRNRPCDDVLGFRSVCNRLCYLYRFGGRFWSLESCSSAAHLRGFISQSWISLPCFSSSP